MAWGDGRWVGDPWSEDSPSAVQRCFWFPEPKFEMSESPLGFNDLRPLIPGRWHVGFFSHFPGVLWCYMFFCFVFYFLIFCHLLTFWVGGVGRNHTLEHHELGRHCEVLRHVGPTKCLLDLGMFLSQMFHIAGCEQGPIPFHQGPGQAVAGGQLHIYHSRSTVRYSSHLICVHFRKLLHV